MTDRTSADRVTGRLPRVFIGSSTEAESVADAVADEIERAAKKHPELATLAVQPWDLVETVETVFESLLQAAEAFDFAVFVFAPDDKVITRGTAQSAPRDNVIYELGLFTGALGRGRTFMLVPREAKIKLPTDLAGVIYRPYRLPSEPRDSKSLRAAVRRACNEVADEMARQLRGEPEVTVLEQRASPKGSELLALKVYADLQEGRLEPLLTENRIVGRSVVHSDYGIGRVISAGPAGPEQLAVVRFEAGLISVPVVELHLTTPSNG